MKNSIVIVFLSVMCIACNDNAASKIDVTNQVKPTRVSLDQVDTPTNAKMDFESTEWDFGEIDQGDAVDYAFKFINSGTDPLIITNAKGSCGCTVPEWPREPVAPGATGVINVKYNSKGKKGKQNKRVTLTTNMVPSQQVLIVKGQVNIKEE
ncbi:MAG: hypothetical protein CND86_01190 [Bacteroidetes bacterium MED-G21]|nr:MAG: hypothetical protein CND86_01190 [Bacteroidetes bacterium MED-G21]